MVEGYPVYGRDEITRRYETDFYIYISTALSTRGGIQKELLESGFIEKDRIINYSNVSKYLSCSQLEEQMVIYDTGLLFCCNVPSSQNEPVLIPWQSTIEETLVAFYQIRDGIIEDLQNSQKLTQCTGCPALCEGYWDQDRKIRAINISLNYPCQLSCIYCDALGNARNRGQHQKNVNDALAVNVIELIQKLAERGEYDQNTPIALSSGEITIVPGHEKLLDFLEQYSLEIFTNGIVYDAKVSQLVARDDGSSLNVSIDAGTKETYQLVKGLDAFYKVEDNVRRYAKEGAHLLLKYILLPENCSQTDMNGFLALVTELRPDRVHISCNNHLSPRELPQTIKDAAAYMVSVLIRERLEYTLLHFDADTQKTIIGNAQAMIEEGK